MEYLLIGDCSLLTQMTLVETLPRQGAFPAWPSFSVNEAKRL